MTPFGTMSIGDLIAALGEGTQSSLVYLGMHGIVPHRLSSYRGYYDHLAIEPETGRRAQGSLLTVQQFVSKLTEAIGGEFDGYKGGTYRMTRDTPIWISSYGEASSNAITGVKNDGYAAIIQTEIVE